MGGPITIEARPISPVTAPSINEAAMQISQSAKAETKTPVIVLTPPQIAALLKLNFNVLNTTQVHLNSQPNSQPVEMGVVEADALVQAVSQAVPDVHDKQDSLRNAVLETTAEALTDTVDYAAQLLKLEEPLLATDIPQETLIKLRERVEALRAFVRAQAEAAETIAESLGSERLQATVATRLQMVSSEENPMTLDNPDTSEASPKREPAYSQRLHALERFRERHPRNDTSYVVMLNPGHLAHLRELGFSGYEEVTVTEEFGHESSTKYGIIYADDLLKQTQNTYPERVLELLSLLNAELSLPMTYYQGHDSLSKRSHEKMLGKLKDPNYPEGLRTTITPEILEQGEKQIRAKLLSPQFFAYLDSQATAYDYLLTRVENYFPKLHDQNGHDRIASLRESLTNAHKVVAREIGKNA